MGTLFVVGVLGAIMPAADAFLSAAASHIVVDLVPAKDEKSSSRIRGSLFRLPGCLLF